MLEEIISKIAQPVAAEILKIVRDGMANNKLMNRYEAREFLRVDNATITRYINAGLLTPDKSSSPKKQFFQTYQVELLAKKRVKKSPKV